MSTLQERALARRIIDSPAPLDTLADIHVSVGHVGGVAYMQMHPDVDEFDAELSTCCMGGAMRGLRYCTCWEPVYDVEQADPQPADCDRLDLPARGTRCGDCAFRHDSPERADEFEAEELLNLAGRGEPFWCHDGMRKPALWRHPKLGDVPGDPDNWTPEIVAGVPYQADGTPALLCAGWAAQRRQVATA